ncbi:amidohydrolase family protein [Rhizohabitans arisaemae]|uniref:amidohydrolase family protein n=1 Tax=Rhizohabitans arisaemae TaxID=2720610 RepID=UPI0024B085AB|nr:amidohydrolase family protein [Rhizohabitans arisaemae]
MIIDVHAHQGPWFFTMDVAALTVAAMDRYGIDLAVVSGTEAVIYDASAGNRSLAAFLGSGAPGSERLYGYVTVNPRRLAAAERDLDAYLPTGRFVGAKIHTDYTGSPIGSPWMREALTLVAAAGVPALVHTWGTSVLDLARVCRDIPGLRVIAGHMGADGYRHAVEAARTCDRLYLEPCWSHFPAGRIAEVAAAVDPGRLLFGTDSTLIDPASAFGSVAAAGLTGDAADRLAWRNAADLFRLPIG